VGVGDGLRLEQACEQPHRFPFSDFVSLLTRHYPRRLRRHLEGSVHWPILRVKVAERSMEPALRPGDWLLVRRTRRIRPGQVVLARHPERPEMLIVKRAARRAAGGWWLESDNPEAGAVDSRRFGAVPVPLIEGRVLARYWRPRRPA
jgi:nickel-type superoxide dismutase maturation protease